MTLNCATIDRGDVHQGSWIVPLKFPGAWRYKPPADGEFANRSVPLNAVRVFLGMIMKVSKQGGDRRTVLEHFKGFFCAACGTPHFWSSSESWADSDLDSYARQAAENAPLFIEAFYDACVTFVKNDTELWAPDADLINRVLADHKVGYVIDPPQLRLRENAVAMIAVPTPPPTIAEQAKEVLQTSAARAEELLAEGRGREAVQESLWLLETVATAFRGLGTATRTVEGKYFNQIVKDLRAAGRRGTLTRVLDWVSSLHGFLSSPTGGGVRHGLDLNEGVVIDDNDARLFCNLIRSYLSFLMVEHERLSAKESKRT